MDTTGMTHTGGRRRACGRWVTSLALVAALAVPALAAGPAAGEVAFVPAGQEPVGINAQNLAFNPAEIQVPAGATVVWTNNDPFGHTVTADDGSFDSGMLDPGTSYAVTFLAPGVYTYYCQPHGSPGLGGMAGTVVVVGDAAPAPAPAEEPVANPDLYY